MKYSDLVKFKNGGMEIDEKGFSIMRAGNQSSQIGIFGISAGSDSKAAQILGTKVLKLSRSGGGTGVWVPYLANCTVYGYLTGGQTWAASGPFSGCYYEVGTSNGQVYVAHISCEERNDPNVEAWKSVLPNRTVLFSAKMSMSRNLPVGASNAAAIAFASISGGAVECTRVDVQTASFGGMTGPIFDVQPVANGS